jgi:hypothetical protein
MEGRGAAKRRDWLFEPAIIPAGPEAITEGNVIPVQLARSTFFALMMYIS